ncbi:hypothetical protein [Bifidobacterium sp. ESL0764]|uniref:hypothetical protein n=1 Tax=Bifidobacterium sp. ESL0764 TaxID=2983228 RepID=UPI0023F7F16D|nr:hypothetical protein [Bifidobacterium sp. ESL0764]WEV66004.1 hypothetical protein OZX71_01190 [Bifidobacterium sp. ESL0764]
MSQKFIADNGTVITDEMVDQWAQEAENGFQGAEIRPFEGRAWEVKSEPLKPRTIRVSDSVWGLVERQAKVMGVSVSEYVRRNLINGLTPQKA